MNGVTGNIMQEISSDEIQKIMDETLKGQSFDFAGYVGSLINGRSPFSFEDAARYILNGIHDNIVYEKNIYIYLVIIAVMGALIANFSKLLQGKKVAETAFYMVYMLFFSVLAVSFTEVCSIASDTLVNVSDFIKIFSTAYFTCIAFTNGSMAGSVFYEFTLVMMNVTSYVVVKFALPAIQFYFFLRIASQISEEDVFSRLAKLVKDVVSTGIKTMFGIIMGINVVQGLVVPVAAEAKNSMLVKMGSAIPGIGNTVGSVTSTVLYAGKLVKNAVGITGIIVVVVICVLPLVKILISKFLYQLISAFIQPVSDKRLVNCIDAVVDSLKMQIYAVGTGCMIFVVSIALISAMTT